MDEILKVTTKKKLRKVPTIVENQLTRDELIREMAYKLFEERNGEHGDANSDWLAAEAHLAIVNV